MRREWGAKRLRIIARDNHCCKKCGAHESKDVPLHVHHLHYIYGLDPWEYKDSELVTLCEKCHNEFHSSHKVPVYRLDDGNLVEVQYTPCYRCHGAGWFPEYKHVQGGICFRCHGARYEEMISVVEDYAKEHDINIDEINMGFRPLAPEVKDLGTIIRAVVRKCQNKDGVFVSLVFNDGRLAHCCLDYSVDADPGDELEVSTLMYKDAIKKNGEGYIILKGKVSSDGN